MATHNTDIAGLEDASFGIELEETGGQSGGYHPSNDPQAPYQRKTVMSGEERSTFDVRRGRLCTGS